MPRSITLLTAALAAALSCRAAPRAPSVARDSVPPAPSAPSADPAPAARDIGPGTAAQSRLWVEPGIEHDCPGYHTVNRRFLPRLGDSSTVLVETVDTKQWRCEEGVEATTTLVSWPMGAVGVGTPRWTYTGEGEPAPTDGFAPFYRLKIRGCCGPGDLDRYVAGNGKVMFESSGPLLQLEQRRTVLFRFASVEDNYSAIAIPEAEHDSTVVAAIMYGPPNGPVQRAILHANEPSEYHLDSVAFLYAPVPPLPSLPDSEEFRRDRDPAEIRDVAIAGRLSSSDADVPDLVFNVPIVADRIDGAHARLSPGMHISP